MWCAQCSGIIPFIIIFYKHNSSMVGYIIFPTESMINHPSMPTITASMTHRLASHWNQVTQWFLVMTYWILPFSEKSSWFFQYYDSSILLIFYSFSYLKYSIINPSAFYLNFRTVLKISINKYLILMIFHIILTHRYF